MRWIEFASNNPDVPRLELYPFRYRDPRTGKWVKARYKAEWHEIAARYAEYEVLEPVEVRNVDPEARYFTPHTDPTRPAGPPPVPEPIVLESPAIDALEAFLVRLFLRRYVTLCARQRRYSAMNGAARLFTELSPRERKR